jgi:hypothetical protein
MAFGVTNPTISDNSSQQPLTDGVDVQVGNLSYSATGTAGHTYVITIISQNGPFFVASMGNAQLNGTTLTASWTPYSTVGNNQILRVEEFDGNNWTTTDTLINVVPQQ